MSSKLRSNQAHRKEARRQGARDRFEILTEKQYMQQFANRRRPSGAGNGDMNYAAYLENKQIEAKALGL